MNPYEEKQAERKARLERAAETARSEAESAFKSAHDATSQIPMGQPILVGHHSEGKHRRAIDRSDRAMRRGVEADKRAEDLERRAEGVGKAGISSDDPDAIEKLRAELQEVETLRDIEKRGNANIRKLAGGRWSELTHEERVSVVSSVWPAGARKGLAQMAAAFPWLPQFGNGNAAKIKRIKERISELEASATEPERAPIIGVGYKVIEDKEANRLRVSFEEKRDEIHQVMRSLGFVWSPREKAYQRKANAAAWSAAQQAIKRLF